MGRITRDLELKQTQNGVSVLSFTIAVDRNFVKQGEERQTDFINCVAWRQQAEFISRYFGKGRMIAIEGQIRTRTYEDNNNNKRTATEVYVDSVSFTGEAKQGGSQGGYQQNNYQRSNYQEPAPAPAPDPSAPLNLGDIDDFEVLSDEGVPF